MRNYLKFQTCLVALLFMVQNNATFSSEYTTEELTVKDFTYNNLAKYSVDSTTGKLYRIDDNNEIIYPVYPINRYNYTETNNDYIWGNNSTPENKYVYDLQFMLAKCINHTYAMPDWTGGNLLIRTVDSNYTYTMTNPTATVANVGTQKASLKVRLNYDTNIIIPYGVTLKEKDLMFVCGKLSDTDNMEWYDPISLCFIVFGNIISDDTLLQNDSRYTDNFYPESVIDIHWPTKANIIIGPNATFYQNNTTTGVSPIYSGSNYTN